MILLISENIIYDRIKNEKICLPIIHYIFHIFADFSIQYLCIWNILLFSSTSTNPSFFTFRLHLSLSTSFQDTKIKKKHQYQIKYSQHNFTIILFPKKISHQKIQKSKKIKKHHSSNPSTLQTKLNI